MNKKYKHTTSANSMVEVPKGYGFFKRFFVFFGPAYLISVGYMDPGNWATDIAGGSRFGYALIWVLFMSNLMALVLQSLSARLGIVTGMDLAQQCRQHYSKAINFTLWILSEIAIAATDLAEVLGSAIGLQLLFGLPLIYGIILTAFDTLLILVVHNLGVRKMEAFIIGLVSIIGISFLFEIIISKPDIHGIGLGFIPSLPGKDALFIAMGIIGATIMPHNLYLHSSLVQSRKIEKTPKGIREAIKFNILDSTIALNIAFLVNASILIMSAAVFFGSGNKNVAGIQQAFHLLEPLLGTTLAPVLFGIALICSGQSSTITGTLSGQIVMEGFVNIRLQPWVRRLVTRIIAISPAIISTIIYGENSSGNLLVISQVILSLQLSFAIIPLIHFVGSKAVMKEFTVSMHLRLVSWLIALTIITLNIKLVIDTLNDWVFARGFSIQGLLTLATTVALFLLLLCITFEPVIPYKYKLKSRRRIVENIHGEIVMPTITEIKPYKKVLLALDFSDKDKDILSHGVNMTCGGAVLVLMHVVESVGAKILGNQVVDVETVVDTERINRYAEELRSMGIRVITEIGYGDPSKSLTEMIAKHEVDIAIFGSHGHKGIFDWIFGTTTNRVKHNVSIPILIAQ